MRLDNRSVTTILWTLLSVAGSSALPALAPAAPPTKTRLQRDYGRLPLRFELNCGQTDESVRFLSRGPGYSLFLTSGEAVLSIDAPARRPAAAPPTVVRMKLAGGRRDARLVGLDPLPGKSNYFVGNDPDKWKADVPAFGRVEYEAVYPGVDLVFHGSQRTLEYDLVVAPGADSRQIGLTFQGAAAIRVDAGGDLLLSTGDGELRQRRPVAYQEIEGRREIVAARYRLARRGEVRIDVGRYDRTRALVIDPLIYSSNLGGEGDEFAFFNAVDSAGNAYVTGTTNSTSFPRAGALQGTNNGGGDVFVTKLNAAGNGIVFSTYLGGSGHDEGQGIAVDGSGNVYVTGNTDSTDFPTMNPFQSSGHNDIEAFVAKLNPAGNALVYSTYLGGSGSFGDFAYGIAVDASGSAYVSGDTDSLDFPTTPGVFQRVYGGGDGDYFVTKFTPAGNALVFSTYIGGSGGDFGRERIAVDASGFSYITGTTDSTDFPTVNAFQKTLSGSFDATVTKLNADGTALLYSTYLGGSHGNEAVAIALDGANNAYVTGYTTSTDFPTAHPIQPASGGGSKDAFVTKLNAAGNALFYSTYLGGSGTQEGRGIAVDSGGNAYVAGFTDSPNFPTSSPIQAAGAGSEDAFVAKLNAAGSAFVYSTYLGGGGGDVANAIALDSASNAYVTGTSDSADFPRVNALQGTNAGGFDAFVAKLGASGGCGDATTFCANGNRFTVRVAFATPQGQTGNGQAVALTGDTGYFWFFTPSNVELVVKVVDGRAVNSRFWVFAGGLTNVGVVITVTDALTGAVNTYTNPQGVAFLPIQDTAAFSARSPEESGNVPTGEVSASLPDLVSLPPVLPRGAASEAAACVSDATTLCLNNGRYKVQTQFTTPQGQSGVGQAVVLTGDTGYFWFFSANNVEMVVKALNACTFDSRYWIFAGGLTNVSVAMTVTDTQSGAVKVYTNPQGTAFQPIQDTNAFATCP